MKTRITISLLVLFVFGLCGFFLDKDDFTAHMPILFLIAVTFILLVLFISAHQEAEKQEEEKKTTTTKKRRIIESSNIRGVQGFEKRIY